MKKRLSLISPLQLGVVLAVFYGLLSLIIIVPMGALSAVFWTSHHAVSGPAFHAINSSPALIGGVFGGITMILMPILYAAMGFIFGVIGGVVYNLVAKWTGGIEFTVTAAPES